MARVKGVKRLKDEPGFNGAIGESIFCYLNRSVITR